MADKRQLKYDLRRLQQVKTWQLLVLLVFAGFIAATFLRLNNIGMIQRRDAVMQADKSTNTTVTQTRLYDLQRYVAGHMNTDMGVIYLENQYKRDSQKVIDAASSDSNPNGNVFKKAQEVCAPRYAHLGSYSQAYQQCVLTELSNFAPAGSPVDSVKLPKTDQYRFSFVSPVWSPDFAGFSVLACALIALIIIVRSIAYVVLKLFLNFKHRSV